MGPERRRVASKSDAALPATPLTFSHRPTVRIGYRGAIQLATVLSVCHSSGRPVRIYYLVHCRVPGHGHETYGVGMVYCMMCTAPWSIRSAHVGVGEFGACQLCVPYTSVR